MVKQVTMAPNGPQFSEVVQGYWRMGDWGMNPQQYLEFVEQHLELGITTVDHAHLYGGEPSCEELFGRVLALDSTVRDRIQIVSKCGINLTPNDSGEVNHYDSTPAAIEASVETSLTRLGIEQLDVLLLHRPDWLMDVDAVSETFEKLKSAGKVAHFGVSNFTASQFGLLQSRLDEPLVTNQVEINPLNHQAIKDGSLDLAYQHRIRPMAWSCLAGGQIFSAQTEQAVRVRNCLQQVAKELETVDIDALVYAWVYKLPSKPVVIVGSGNIERVRTATQALSLKLSQEQWYRILVAAMGCDVP